VKAALFFLASSICSVNKQATCT